MKVLSNRNWWTLLHMRQADAACAPTRWQHFSVRNYDMAAILTYDFIKTVISTIRLR